MKMIVVDQNVMREPPLAECIRDEPNTQFIVPDVALVEMTKSTEWESTMRPSLAVLAPEVRRTYMSMSVGEAIRREQDGGTIDRAVLLPPQFQRFIRGFIGDLSTGSEGDAISKVRRGIGTTRAELLVEELDAEAAKARVESMVGAVVKGLKPEILKGLRNGSMGDPERLALIKLNGDYFFMQTAAAGMNAVDAEVFLAKYPIQLRFLYLTTRVALKWAIEGGMAMAKPKTVNNDLLDMQYAIIASYFDGLLSDDKGANGAYDDLQILMKMRHRVKKV